MQPDIILDGEVGKRPTVARWRTLADFVVAFESEAASDGSSHERTQYYKEWSGCTIDWARDVLLGRGWDEAVSSCEGLDGLTSDSDYRPQLVRSVAGAFPIVPVYLQGDPQCIYDVRQEKSDAKRALTLIIDMGYSAAVKAAEAMRHAQAIMRVVAWMQAEQIACEVISADATLFIGNSEGKACIDYTLYRVKRADMPYAPERIASALHPGWLRRVSFSLVEHHAKAGILPKDAPGNYGRSQQLDLRLLAKAIPDAESIVVTPKVGTVNPEQALKHVINLKLKRVG